MTSDTHHHSAPRARLARLAVLTAAVAAMSACGGGGGDDSAASAPPPSGETPAPAPAPGPAPGPAPSPGPAPAPGSAQYYTFGYSQASPPQSGYTLHIVDAGASPPQVVLSTPTSDNRFAFYGRLEASAEEPAGLTLRDAGGVRTLVHVHAGQVYKIDLSKGSVPTPTRIASMTDACYADMAHTHSFQPAGDDAWIAIVDAGADGNCSTTADNRTVFVRASSTGSTPPTALPDGARALVALTDAGGRLQGLLVHDPSSSPARLRFYQPDLVTATDVQGAGTVARAPLLRTRQWASADHDLYLDIDGRLHRINWSAAGASVSAALHAFSGSDSSHWIVNDRPASYLADARRLYRLQGDAAPVLVAELPAEDGEIVALTQSATRLVVAQRTEALRVTLRSVAKSNGSMQTIAAPPGNQLISTLPYVHGEHLLYMESPQGDGAQFVQIYRANADGSGITLVSDRARFAGIVSDDTFSPNAPWNVRAVFYCLVPANATDCRNGTLRQVDIADGAEKEIGTFASSGTQAQWIPFALDTSARAPRPLMVMSFTSSSPMLSWYDMYLLTPDVAGSLVRITQLVP